MTLLQLTGLIAIPCLLWVLLEMAAWRESKRISERVNAALDHERAAHDAFMATVKRMGKE